MAKAKSDSVELNILPISQGRVNFVIVGETPLYFNRMSEKAKRQLLLGGSRKTSAERAEALKHDPIAEFRASVYRHPGADFPTRLKFPGDAFRKAMGTAALDIPGARKTEIGRLTNIGGLFNVDVYGIPRLAMDVVRSADAAKTPDIRTRAILPRWCCAFGINFIRPKLTEKAVGHLMAAAGVLCGIGDWRQEKGSASFGSFRLVDVDDAEFAEIVRTGAREAQDEALLNPVCYNEESQELLDWYHEEILRRGRENQSSSRRKAKPEAPEQRVLS